MIYREAEGEIVVGSWWCRRFTRRTENEKKWKTEETIWGLAGVRPLSSLLGLLSALL